MIMYVYVYLCIYETRRECEVKEQEQGVIDSEEGIVIYKAFMIVRLWYVWR